MSLQQRLLLSMVVPALLIALLGVVGTGSLRHLEQVASRILADNYRSIQEARRIERALGRRELARAEALAPPAGARTPPARPSAAAEIAEALARCEANITEPGEAVVLGRIRQTWETMSAAPGSGAPVDGPAGPTQTARLTALHDDLAALVALNERAMIASERATRRTARVMQLVVGGASLAAVLALALFALVSARRIASPVSRVADRLHRALNPAHDPGPAGRRQPADEILRLAAEQAALLERLARHEDEHRRRLTDAEERLAFVVREVLEGLVLVDHEQRILAVNPMARRLLGPGAEEGRTLPELQSPDEVRQLLAPLADGRYLPERDLGELRFEVDGEARCYRLRVVTVSARPTEVAGYLILFWDVTEQQRFADSRKRFIAMLSHQLKTPMTSLAMAVGLLREKLQPVTPLQTELLSIASESCDTLAGLIAELIDAAREATPGLVVKPRRLELTRLLRAALRPLLPQAAERGVELVLPEEGAAILATVDPVKFPWVVTNIAGNALRYTARGGRIVVTLTAGSEQLEVSVADTGRGIAPDKLAHLFSPRAGGDDEAQPGTHGLGLAIAKEIVEAHQGQLSADSAPGQGATFRIRLPLRPGGRA